VDYSVAGPYRVVVANPCGSVTSYVALLAIADATPPTVLTWPTNRTIAANASCQAQLPDLTPEVTASDNCGPVTPWQSPPAGSWVGPGQTLVTVSVHDQAGNAAQQPVTLTIVDVTPPILTACATNRTLAAGPACATLLPDLIGEIIATYACGAVTVTQNPPPGAALGLGPALVTFSARDPAGNSNGCSAIVTVVDLTPPVITCPSNLTTFCTGTNGAPVSFTPIVSDNCDPAPLVTSVPPSGACFAEGTTTVTCTVRDFSGNSNSCVFTVTVIDPVPALLAITRSPTNVLITWPQSCRSFALESARNLDPTNTWSRTIEEIQVSGTNYAVEIVPDGTDRFFRLRRQ
jgi:hypothetical protein